MVIEFLAEWAIYQPGQVALFDGGAADVLIRRGIARPRPVATPAADTAATTPTTPKQPKTRRGGR